MTNSPDAGPNGLRGNQTPALSVVPAWDTTEADDAIFLSSRYGLVPDEWQVTVLRGSLGRRDGRWSAPRVGLDVARQNGKNAVIEIVELFKMVLLGRRILHTAHEVKTCRKAFSRLLEFFDNERQYPELRALVREIRRTNGQEAIVLRNGGSCEFIARSRGSGRGFTVDDLVLDEAQELADDELAALLPTISAAPSGDPQVFMAGTPPLGDIKGEAFARERSVAQAGGDGRLAWFEWSNPADADTNDPTVVANANPALGIRLGWGTVEDERSVMGESQFARERCGIWEALGSASVIDPDLWRSLGDPDSKPGSHVAFAVDVPVGGREASIARAGERPDGNVHLEVDSRPGTGWAVERLALVARRRNAVVALDGGSRAAALIEPLRKAGIEPVVYGTRDVVTACSGFMDRIDEGGLRHMAQLELNLAVDVARRRKVGDAWAWHRRDTSVSISPLVAATLAVHALKEPPPKRKTGRVLAV